MSYSLYIFLFCFLVSSVLSLPTFQYQTRHESLLGYDLKYALFELNVNEPLYIFEGMSCTPGCKELPTDCTPCDFSWPDPEKCGVSNKISNDTDLECNCDQKSYWCDDKEQAFNQFERVDESKIYGPYTIDPLNPDIYARFYFDKPCYGINLRVIHHYGLTVANIDPDMDVQVIVFSTAFPTINLCPHDHVYQFGTFAIRLYGFWSQSSKVSIKMTYFDLGTKKVEFEAAVKCENDKYNAYCLKLNVPNGPIALGAGQAGFFRFDIDRCQTLHVYSERVWTPTRVAGVQGNPLYNFDSPGYSAFFAGNNGPHSVVLGVCPENEGQVSILYFTLLNLNTEHHSVLTVTNDSSTWTKRSLSSYTVDDGIYWMVGTFDFYCEKKQFTCRRIAWAYGVSCLEAFTVIPTESKDGLWPRPYILSKNFPDTFLHLPYSSSDAIINDTLAGGFFFEINVGNQQIVPYSKWETHFEQECYVKFPPYSHIVNADGLPYHGIFRFNNTRKEGECDVNSFEFLSNEIDDLISLMGSVDDSVEILAIRYVIDTKAFVSAWQNCDRLIHQFITQESQNVTYFSSQCLIQNEEERKKDPCCDSSVEWTECCVPRSVSFEEESLKVDSHKLNSLHSKNKADCSETLLEDYIFNSKLRDSATGCDTVVTETLTYKQFQMMNFFRECKENILGFDGKGKECQSDNECRYNCDLFQNVCVYNNEKQKNDIYLVFFECIDDNIPIDAKEYVQKILGSDSSKPFVDLLKENYMMNECVSPFGRSEQGEGHRMIPYSTVSCLLCDYFCFDETCIPPQHCEMNKQYGRPGTICPFTRRYTRTNSQRCISDKVCNVKESVDQIITEEECNNYYNYNTTNTSTIEEEQYVCAICETPTSCIEIKGITTEEQCLQQIKNVCVVDSETFIIGISDEDQCKNLYGRCSVSCDRCNESPSICEANGECSDLYIKELIKESQLLQYTPEYEGLGLDGMDLDFNEKYYVTEMSEWNDPDCAFESLFYGLIPTNLGCLLTSNYTFEYLNINSIPYNEFEYARNKEECESRSTCHEKKIITKLTSPKDEHQCLLCDADYTPLFKWEYGKWIYGHMREVVWVKREWKSISNMEQTIDFNKLSKHIANSVTEQYSLELQTQAQCRMTGLKRVMNDFLCINYEKDSEKCFVQNSGSLEIGVGKVCPKKSISIVAPPSVISFYSSTVISSSCISVSVLSQLSSEIKSSQASSISTSFRKISKSKDNIKNNKGAFVGEFVGNGVEIMFLLPSSGTFSSSSSSLRPYISNFTLCLTVENQKENSGKVYDFGWRVSVDDVRPLGLNVVYEEGLLCGLLTMIQLYDLIIFPIQRDNNWENKNNSDEEVSTAEIIVLTLLIVIYSLLIGFMVLLDFLEQTQNAKTKSFNTKRLLAYLLVSCLIIRVVYFILLLSKTLSSNSDSLSEFILVEIPTYLYFLALSLAAIIWYMASEATSSRDMKKETLTKFAFCCAIALLFVIPIIIAWELTGETGEYSCGGRVYQEPDNTSQEYIRFSYRIVLGLAALGICGALTIYGGSIYSVLKNSKVSEHQQEFRRKIYIIGIVATISLLSQTIFFSIYTAVIESSYEWALMLIPLEWFPTLIIAFVLSSARLTSASQTSSSNVKGSNSSASNT